MLTLVAAVLAYDMPREMCDIREALSLMVDAFEASPRLRRGAFESRSVKSWTRLEKDMMKQRWYLFWCRNNGQQRGRGVKGDMRRRASIFKYKRMKWQFNRSAENNGP